MRPLAAAILCSLVATCGQKGPLSPPGEHVAGLPGEHVAGYAPAAATAAPRPPPPPAPRLPSAV